MPAFLPIILATSHILLAADNVPQFNIEPSCRAAHEASVDLKRNEADCKRDELAARDKLKQEWSQFSASQRTQCAQLSTLGGYPSYVEMLTCLEIDRDANRLPADDQGAGKAYNPPAIKN
jgi:hypothetical protein